MSHGPRLVVWASISALVALGCGDDSDDSSTASDAPTDVATDSDATESNTEDDESDGVGTETDEPSTDDGGGSGGSDPTDDATDDSGELTDDPVESDDLDGTDDDGSDGSTDAVTDPDDTDPDDTDPDDTDPDDTDSSDSGSETDPEAGNDPDPGQPDIPPDTPLVNDGMGSLGGEPQDGLALLNSNIHLTDTGSWLWLGVVENTTDDSTFCRINVDGVVMFDTGDEVEFVAGSVIAPMYSPQTDSLTLPCLGPGDTGVLAALAQSLLNGVALSQVVGITYGVSAEDWTANDLARLELLTLTDAGATETGSGTVIAGTAVAASETLTGVKAFVFPSTTSGIPLRLFELNGPDLDAGEAWEFESPNVDVEFSDQIVHFAYTRE